MVKSHCITEMHYTTRRAVTALLFVQNSFTNAVRTATVHDSSLDVAYEGVVDVHGIETFYGIPYAKDTSGQHRFKPPRPFTPAKGSTINAQSAGPACPQPMGDIAAPLYLSNITEVSEDCLHLNVRSSNRGITSILDKC